MLLGVRNTTQLVAKPVRYTDMIYDWTAANGTVACALARAASNRLTASYADITAAILKLKAQIKKIISSHDVTVTADPELGLALSVM